MSAEPSVPDAASVSRQQKRLLFGGGSGLFALLLGLMWLADDQPQPDGQPLHTAKVEQVEAVARKISDEEIWTAKADAALQEMRRNNEAIKQQMAQVKRDNETLNTTVQEQRTQMQALQQAAAQDKQDKPADTWVTPPLPAANLDAIVPPLASGTTALPAPLDTPAQPAPLPAPPQQPEAGIVHIIVGEEAAPDAAADTGAPSPAAGVQPISQAAGANPSQPLVAPQQIAVTDYTGKDSGHQPPTALARPKQQTYLPSGSFFKAELIASLDAPTGGNAQQNPHPVLLVVRDNAFLPNRFRAKAKECHVLASGYGDIASERVNLRTEKLSCVLKDGTVIDTKLDAYIAGEDGKSGVRGNLVSKQGALIANALLAGTLGGLGQGLAQAATTVTQTGSGAVTSVSPNQALEFGLYTGSGSALNKLADYYIKAAEKTFPILEVAAGREVTIILLSGLDMAGDFSGTSASQHSQAALQPMVTAADQAQAGKSLRREVSTW